LERHPLVLGYDRVPRDEPECGLAIA